MTLLVFYGYNSGVDGLLVVLDIKPGPYNIDGYGFGACGLPV